MADSLERQPSEISRRERKKDETRERIATAAMELFLERGYAATTVDEISQRADVAKGTFFNYFPRKEAVLAHHASQDLDLLEELVDQALSNPRPARDMLATVFERGTASYEKNPELSRVLFLEMLKGPETELFEAHSRAHNALRRLVDHAQRNGELKRDVDPDRVTELLRGMFISTTLVWLHCPTLYDLRSEIRARLRLILDGIAAAKR